MGLDFGFLFDNFSKRNAARLGSLTPLSPEFRNRIFLLCVRTFPRIQDGIFQSADPFWWDIHDRLSYHIGRTIKTGKNLSMDDAVIQYLTSCGDSEFLDFIELVPQTQQVMELPQPLDFINGINQFLRLDNLPYSLTRYSYDVID